MKNKFPILTLISACDTSPPCRPPHVQHHLSIEALVGVLRRAIQKRKYIRDEKTADKLDLKKEETSRSNSQASDSRPNLPQQSSTGERSFCMYPLVR